MFFLLLSAFFITFFSSSVCFTIFLSSAFFIILSFTSVNKLGLLSLIIFLSVVVVYSLSFLPLIERWMAQGPQNNLRQHRLTDSSDSHLGVFSFSTLLVAVSSIATSSNSFSNVTSLFLTGDDEFFLSIFN